LTASTRLHTVTWCAIVGRSLCQKRAIRGRLLASASARVCVGFDSTEALSRNLNSLLLALSARAAEATKSGSDPDFTFRTVGVAV